MTTKKLTIIKGRGTKNETRIQTDITLYWCERLGRWVSIPHTPPGAPRARGGEALCRSKSKRAEPQAL